MATAGHCADKTGLVVRAHLGASDNDPVRIGTVRFVAGTSGSMDFGLVQVDPSLYPIVDGRMAFWGNASRPITNSEYERGMLVRQYGHGSGFDSAETTRARTGIAWETNGSAFSFSGITTPGDSGSPVMTDSHLAVGVVTSLQAGVSIASTASSPGVARGILLGAVIDAAAVELGLDLSLVQGPYS